MAAPAEALRSSPVARLFEAHTDKSARVHDLAIADLSHLPRTGMKGPGTVAVLARYGIATEAHPNRGFRQADGSLCLMLGTSEALILGDPFGAPTDRIAALDASWPAEAEQRSYLLPRRSSHAWIAIAGRQGPDLLAKLAAVDFSARAFTDLAVAQTPVAGVTGIVARDDRGRLPLLYLLADRASAHYLCECLMDAAREFQGGLVGLDALRNLDLT